MQLSPSDALCDPSPDKAQPLWHPAASMALHAGLIGLFFLLPPAEIFEEEEIIEIPIDIIFNPPVAQPKQQAKKDALPIAPVSPEPIEPQQENNPDGMIRPQTMLSGTVLDQENNKLARQALRWVPKEERREQLCTLEAMEQLAVWDKNLRPDLLLSYVFAETRWEKGILYADGAAMMSKGQWYYLSYECQPSTDLRQVEDFAFKLGDPVPRRLWEGYDLIEQVHDTAQSVENYNAKTRPDQIKAR